MTRTHTPDTKWLASVASLRTESPASAPGYSSLLVLLWREGYGTRAAAAMADWYCSCHPGSIRARQKGGA